MATYIPGGVDIPVKGITNGSTTNQDGHGWAVAAGSELVVGKSMQFYDALEDFVETRQQMGQGSIAMFHSRFGTHGDMGEYNIHPFYVADDSVMAHNGILPDKYHPTSLKDRRSDTRIFVDRIASFVDNPNGVPSRRGAAHLGRRIGTGNKLVFISTRSGQPKVRIVNSNQGIQVDGVWYSNTGYLTDYSWYGWRRPMDRYDWRDHDWKKDDRPVINGGWVDDGVHGSTGWQQYDDEGKEIQPYVAEACAECGSKDLDQELGMCNDCVSCLDCHDNFAYCLCWRAGGERTAVERIQTIG